MSNTERTSINQAGIISDYFNHKKAIDMMI